MLVDFVLIGIAILFGCVIGYNFARSHKSGQINAVIDTDNEVYLRLEIDKLEDIVDHKVVVLTVKKTGLSSQD